VPDPDSNPLCLECGLCCNGVIFADVQLEPDDDPARLRSLGLQIVSRRGVKPKFTQPCAAFDGCRCHVYGDRPAYCRQFECLLLKSVKAGETDRAAALRVIRSARQTVDKVKRLLRELGDADEPTALGKRFRRMQRRMEQGSLDADRVNAFGELTLAMHELNVLLSAKFYM
jgi:hypothetical protein